MSQSICGAERCVKSYENIVKEKAQNHQTKLTKIGERKPENRTDLGQSKKNEHNYLQQDQHTKKGKKKKKITFSKTNTPKTGLREE